MLHQSRVALGLLLVSWVAAAALPVALLPGCQSREVSPQKEVSAKRGPTELTAQASPREQLAAENVAQEGARLDITSGKPPEDWPSEVPLYPGAKILMSMKASRGHTLTLETPDPSSQVQDYYETQLARLQPSSAVDVGPNRTLLWSDPSKPLQVTLALSAMAGKTRATLVVTRERAQ